MDDSCLIKERQKKKIEGGSFLMSTNKRVNDKNANFGLRLKSLFLLLEFNASLQESCKNNQSAIDL